MNDTNVQKKIIKKRRLNLKKAFILALVIFIIGGILYYAFKLNVSSVTVSGANYISDSEIIKASNVLNKKFLMVTSHQACKNIKNNDLINTCKIKKSWWLKINIIVTENKPLFIYKENGSVMLSNGSQTKKSIYGIPTLINYVPKKVLSKFIKGLTQIDDDIIQSISEIEYAPSIINEKMVDENRFLFRMNDGNIVYINTINIEKYNNYLEIYEALINKSGDTKGCLYLDSNSENKHFNVCDEVSKRSTTTDGQSELWQSVRGIN